MKQLTHPNVKKYLYQQMKVLLEKECIAEALALAKDSVISSQVTQEDSLYFKLLAQIYEKNNEHLMSQMMGFKAQSLAGALEDAEADKLQQALLQEQQQSVLNQKENGSGYYTLGVMYASRLRMVEACLCYKMYKNYTKDAGKEDELYTCLQQYEGIGRVEAALESGKDTYCIWSEGIEDSLSEQVLLQMAKQLGKAVYWVRSPLNLQVPREEFRREGSEVLVEEEGYTAIYPICFESDGEKGTCPLEKLWMRMGERYVQSNCWVVIGLKQEMKAITKFMPVYKQLQRFYVEPGEQESTLAIYLMGNYFESASYLYGFDVAQQMQEEPSCRISIVIPVRGYVETLEWTLRSCLNQRFKDFEVVLSDNSDPGDDRIYQLAQKLADSHLSYYRTPYVLPLQKSFEYAFLRAKGEFMFALGADDGALPYTAGHIVEIFEKNPEENIILWDRMYYTWADAELGGQGDTFSFYNNTERDRYNTHVATRDFLLGVLLDELNKGRATIYSLPMLYINSGMRRKHIQEMVRRTGKFLDGSSQDVYTGIVTLAMYDHVLYEGYPITVSGTSNKSIGATTVKTNRSISQYKSYVATYNLATQFVEIPSTPSQIWMFPQFDYTLFTYELLKVKDLEIDPIVEEWVKTVEFLNMFSRVLKDNECRPEECIDTLGVWQECAERYSKFTGDWVRKYLAQYPAREALSEVIQMQPLQAKTKDKESEAFIGYYGRNITVLCETMGIHNLYEATQFVVKLFNI